MACLRGAPVHPIRNDDRPACSERSLATTPATHREAFLAVQPINLLVVYRPTFPLQQDQQAPIPEPSPLVRQFT